MVIEQNLMSHDNESFIPSLYSRKQSIDYVTAGLDLQKYTEVPSSPIHAFRDKI